MVLWVGTYLFIEKNKTVIWEWIETLWEEVKTESWVIVESKQEKTIKEIKADAVREKIETIRKRLALKWLIIEWDAHYRDWQLALALTKYINFYKQNPSDNLIVEKIGDTYREMKKFGSALNYYNKIENPSEEIIEATLLLTSYQIDLDSPESIASNIELYKSMNISEEQKFYYTTSLSCSTDFHECKKKLWETLWQEVGWSWSTIQEISYKKLSNIKQAIQNYRNFQSDDISLKDAFIIWSWYKDELYTLSAHMWEKLLTERSDYKPIIKIVAQSYFELWEYKKARWILWDYYEIDDEDAQVNYMLWIVNTKLREYLVANIYLRKALGLSSENSLNIRRQLIHNFYNLGNEENVLQEFKELIKNETSYTQSDLNLWIYNHILASDYKTASNWAQLWITKFPEDNGNFYAYWWWIERENGNLTRAYEVLSEWIALYPENPFILINLAYTQLENSDSLSAIPYLKKILISSPESEFALQAKRELEKLSQQK